MLAAGGAVAFAATLMLGLASEPAAIAAAEVRTEAAVVAPQASAPTAVTASTPRPAVAPAVTMTAKPVAKVARAAPPVAAKKRVAEPVAGVADGPRQACGEQNFFSLTLCISRECQTPRWQDHPQCVEPRRVEARRQRDVDRF
ncbi:MAG: hypothetical protein ABIR94_13380 [Rubrivivax sp.]